MTWTTFALDIADNIATVRLNRPDELNSLVPGLWRELPETVAASCARAPGTTRQGGGRKKRNAEGSAALARAVREQPAERLGVTLVEIKAKAADQTVGEIAHGVDEQHRRTPVRWRGRQPTTLSILLQEAVARVHAAVQHGVYMHCTIDTHKPCRGKSGMHRLHGWPLR